MKIHLILIHILCICRVSCFLTRRLPCLYFAQFRLLEKNYFSGNVIKKITSTSRTECGNHCLKNIACTFANHKRADGLCELMSSNNNNKTADDEWDLLDSNSGYNQNVGEVCKNNNPCQIKENCRDVCTNSMEHTYVCLNLLNVARSAIGSASSFFSLTLYHPFNAVDGDYNSFFSTGYGNVNWLLLDLRFVYQLKHITVYNRNDCCQDRLNGCVLLVGVNSKIEESTQVGLMSSSMQQTFDYSGYGNYVYITKTPGDVEINIGEVEVYV